MCKIIKKTMIIFSLLYSLTISSYASEYSLNDLIDKGKEFDNKDVSVKGEAIGDLMIRKENAWININDKTNSLGIFMDANDANKIENIGDYNTIGDTIKVDGIFHRACKMHGGDMDIHANNVSLYEEGRALDKKIDIVKRNIAILFTACMFTIGGFCYKVCKE